MNVKRFQHLVLDFQIFTFTHNLFRKLIYEWLKLYLEVLDFLIFILGSLFFDRVSLDGTWLRFSNQLGAAAHSAGASAWFYFRLCVAFLALSHRFSIFISGLEKSNVILMLGTRGRNCGLRSVSIQVLLAHWLCHGLLCAASDASVLLRLHIYWIINRN